MTTLTPLIILREAIRVFGFQRRQEKKSEDKELSVDFIVDLVDPQRSVSDFARLFIRPAMRTLASKTPRRVIFLHMKAVEMGVQDEFDGIIMRLIVDEIESIAFSPTKRLMKFSIAFQCWLAFFCP